MIFDFGRVGVSKLRPYIYRMKKLKYILNDLRFLKALNSPFKPFKVKLYAGKTRIGVPYFYPRKWVKLSEKEIEEKALEKYNKLDQFQKDKVTLEQYKQYYRGTKKAIPKKIGFDFVGLGWKIKWSSTDYRFEWSPLISFVFFKWQIAIIVKVPEEHPYWESWLYYEYNTDKSKSQKERIEQCQKEFKQDWISYKNGIKTKTNYYKLILKKKYIINEDKLR